MGKDGATIKLFDHQYVVASYYAPGASTFIAATTGQNIVACGDSLLLPGILTSSAEEIYTPARYQVSDIYPNPFNPAARVQLQLERQGFVTAELITPLGEKLKTLSQGNFSEGTHTIEVNAEGFRSGVYFVRFIISDAVRQNKSVEIRKAVLLK